MERIFSEKSNIVFKQIIFLIIAASGALFFLFFEIYQKAYLYAGVLIHKIKTACGCTEMSQLIAMHPWIFGALAILSLAVFAFLIYSVYKLVRSIIQTRKFSAKYLINKKSKHSSKVERAILNLNLDKGRIVEIRGSRLVVFCFGLWRPKTCISSGLVKILRKDELEAVLLHEHHHAISREPMKLFIIKYSQNILFFLPGFKTLIKKYFTFSELAADELATDNFKSRSKLSRAIFKISEREEKQLFRESLSLSFFSSVISERVNRLSDDSYMPKFKLWRKRFILGLCSVTLALLTMFVFLSDSSKAFAMHNNGSCVSGVKQNQGESLACNLDEGEQVCAEGSHAHKEASGCEVN
ncbi:M56 family metallopeptidase [Candidatus Falkowbacteria bacterium]|nr:M56 family metallopeptidase [Candidatus Falkowbacteria bacterium]